MGNESTNLTTTGSVFISRKLNVFVHFVSKGNRPQVPIENIGEFVHTRQYQVYFIVKKNSKYNFPTEQMCDRKLKTLTLSAYKFL